MTGPKDSSGPSATMKAALQGLSREAGTTRGSDAAESVAIDKRRLSFLENVLRERNRILRSDGWQNRGAALEKFSLVLRLPHARDADSVFSASATDGSGDDAAARQGTEQFQSDLSASLHRPNADVIPTADGAVPTGEAEQGLIQDSMTSMMDTSTSQPAEAAARIARSGVDDTEAHQDGHHDTHTHERRESTRRSFRLCLMNVRALPRLHPRPAPVARPSESTPGAQPGLGPASAPCAGARSGRKPLDSKGVTPIEGVPERAWQSEVTPPAACARDTPIEGVPEREWSSSHAPPRSRLAVATGRSFADDQGDFWTGLSPLVVRGHDGAPSIECPPFAGTRQLGCSSDDDGFSGGGLNWDDGGSPLSDGEPSMCVAEDLPPSVQDAACQTAAVQGADSPAGQAEDCADPDHAAAEQADEAPVAGTTARMRGAKQARNARPADTVRSKPGEINKRLRRMFRERRSLAGLGTQDEEGRRRSTREKCRPLEWWRQECKVYNREHASLPTVKRIIVHTPEEMWRTVDGQKRRRFKQK